MRAQVALFEQLTFTKPGKHKRSPPGLGGGGGPTRDLMQRAERGLHPPPLRAQSQRDLPK